MKKIFQIVDSRHTEKILELSEEDKLKLLEKGSMVGLDDFMKQTNIKKSK